MPFYVLLKFSIRPDSGAGVGNMGHNCLGFHGNNSLECPQAEWQMHPICFGVSNVWTRESVLVFRSDRWSIVIVVIFVHPCRVFAPPPTVWSAVPFPGLFIACPPSVIKSNQQFLSNPTDTQTNDDIGVTFQLFWLDKWPYLSQSSPLFWHFPVGERVDPIAPFEGQRLKCNDANDFTLSA